MPAFASTEVSQIPLGRSPAQVGVYRYQPNGNPLYEYLDNIRILNIHYSEGPFPGIARFSYVFDQNNPSDDPTSFEEALSVDANLPGVVQNDERLVVFAYNPDDSQTAIFDGFAQVPELSLSPNQELVTFVAYGVAFREWDKPIGGALMRDADDPSTVSDVKTDLLTYFNADGQPNATPSGADAKNVLGDTYPTFLDSLVIRNPDLRRLWTLPMAVRYLCYHLNPDETYVENPNGALIDSLLDSRAPRAGVTILPDDPENYSSEPIIVPDYLATGKPWPVALHELLEPNGFGMVFRLETDLNGDPYTTLELFRRQDGTSYSYKDLYLQAAGSSLDPSQTNLAQARLARDTTDVANTIIVESELVRYEASFVLAPGFSIAPNDSSSPSSLQAFDLNSPSFSISNKDKYRLYVFDETGEGHWDFVSSSIENSVPTMKAILGGIGHDPGAIVKRRRVPFAELFSTDANRKPLKARLAISTDYKGVQPGIWDGSGTWQPVVGGFELLNDRLGIWLNGPNPNSWNIGASSQVGMPYPGGVVKGIEDQANSGATNFILRLTCVIEGDRYLSAVANQRPSSTTSFTLTRRIDARDRYFEHVISANSEFNLTSNAILVRDDTTDAQAEADARRLSSETGEVAGSAIIPRFTNAYRIGDKVRSIVGRNLSLRTNAGAPTEEGEVYPSIVGLTWDFDGKQQTSLQLSDHRGEQR